jgi:DNA-binding response OmpR family regulator
MSNKQKILLVDDDPMIRWTLAEALQEWGYKLSEAESTATALENFAQVQPSIVLLDINLPDGSGLELLRQIKQRQPDTIVIMMTGEVIVENTIAALRSGADDFVGKPINLDELRFALNQAEQKKRRPVPQLPRLLIVTDSQTQANHLMVALGISEVDITVATTPEALQRASEEEHDIILVDVGAEELRGILATLRASPQHAEIPILVEISRVTPEPSLAGVMPQYRAMPCNPTELVSLARRRIASMSDLPAMSDLSKSQDFAGMSRML